jgi:hypothetical protein
MIPVVSNLNFPEIKLKSYIQGKYFSGVKSDQIGRELGA